MKQVRKSGPWAPFPVIRRPLPLPLQGDVPETAKHHQRPVLPHWQAVHELTARRISYRVWCGTIRPSLPCCFSVAERTFWGACSWPLKLVLYAFQSQQMSHDVLPFEGRVRPSLPFCFGVAERAFWGLVAGH